MQESTNHRTKLLIIIGAKAANNHEENVIIRLSVKLQKRKRNLLSPLQNNRITLTNTNTHGAKCVAFPGLLQLNSGSL
jgi:hypothetical protein